MCRGLGFGWEFDPPSLLNRSAIVFASIRLFAPYIWARIAGKLGPLAWNQPPEFSWAGDLVILQIWFLKGFRDLGQALEEEMKVVVGSPGTWSGLLLRTGQCAFAGASIAVMLSAYGFSNYTAFWYLSLLLYWHCLLHVQFDCNGDLSEALLVKLIIVHI